MKDDRNNRKENRLICRRWPIPVNCPINKQLSASVVIGIMTPILTPVVACLMVEGCPGFIVLCITILTSITPVICKISYMVWQSRYSHVLSVMSNFTSIILVVSTHVFFMS